MVQVKRSMALAGAAALEAGALLPGCPQSERDAADTAAAMAELSVQPPQARPLALRCVLALLALPALPALLALLALCHACERVLRCGSVAAARAARARWRRSPWSRTRASERAGRTRRDKS